MNGLGFLALGAGAALITGIVLAKARVTGAISLLLALSPVYLSASLVFLHPRFQVQPAIEMFPAGLLVSLLWFQAWPMIDRINYPRAKQSLLAVLLSLLLAATALLIIYVVGATK